MKTIERGMNSPLVSKNKKHAAGRKAPIAQVWFLLGKPAVSSWSNAVMLDHCSESESGCGGHSAMEGNETGLLANKGLKLK